MANRIITLKHLSFLLWSHTLPSYYAYVSERVYVSEIWSLTLENLANLTTSICSNDHWLTKGEDRQAWTHQCLQMRNTSETLVLTSLGNWMSQKCLNNTRHNEPSWPECWMLSLGLRFDSMLTPLGILRPTIPELFFLILKGGEGRRLGNEL